MHPRVPRSTKRTVEGLPEEPLKLQSAGTMEGSVEWIKVDQHRSGASLPRSDWKINEEELVAGPAACHRPASEERLCWAWILLFRRLKKMKGGKSKSNDEPA